LDTKEPSKKPDRYLRMHIATQVATKVDHPNGKFIDTHLVSQGPIKKDFELRKYNGCFLP